MANPLKPIAIKKSAKRERQKKVLLGLVELYVATGKPIGSNTLRENGFQDLSSATIRNYFHGLEEDGYLSQQHASGGRLPTHKAFRLYAREMLDFVSLDEDKEEDLAKIREDEPEDIAAYLQRAADQLSQITQCAVFLSAPRFDQDFIQDIRLMALDAKRCLCVMLTNFGLVHTEVLPLEQAIEEEALKRIESHFRARFGNGVSTPDLSEEEENIAQDFYKEIMVRYVVGYANYSHEDVNCSGFSKLLAYPEFNDVVTLTSALSLFENPQTMRHLLRECQASKQTRFWIGSDLHACLPADPDCTVIASPYHIGHNAVGAIGILGPTRLPYRETFACIEACAEAVTETLTKTLYKYKISYRQPARNTAFLENEGEYLVEEANPILLEDKRKGRKKKL